MRFVIIGNGAAGNAAARAILRRLPGADVTMISSENHPFYSRVLTSYYVAGKVDYNLVFLAPCTGPGVRTILGATVVGIDPGRGVVVTHAHGEIPYSRLLVATGASPVVPDVPGVRLPGVFTLRTLDDAVGIRRWVTGPRGKDGQGGAGDACAGAPAVVIGGGMVGLKAAEALAALRIPVTVVAASESILSQVLDAEAAGIVQENLERAGVRFRIGDDVVAFRGDGRVEGVSLRSGRSLEARTVIVGRGVRPNTSPVRGLPISVNRGIIVDKSLRTSVDGIYAAGDACEAFDPLRGRSAVNALWTTAVEQGKVAGENMAGACMEYGGGVASNSFRFGGFCVSSFGDARGAGGDRVVARRRGPGWRRVVIRDGRIVGAVEVGPGRSMGVLRALALKQSPAKETTIQAIAEAFLDGNLSFAHVAFRAGVTVWPGSMAGR